MKAGVGECSFEWSVLVMLFFMIEVNVIRVGNRRRKESMEVANKIREDAKG